MDSEQEEIGAGEAAAASPGADANAGAEADTKSEPKADPAPPVDALSVYFIGAEGDLKVCNDIIAIAIAITDHSHARGIVIISTITTMS